MTPPVQLESCSLRLGGFRLGPADLIVPESTRVLLRGPNGSGKTTLLRLAAGLIRPQSGHVWIDGTPAHHRAVAPRVGFVADHRSDLPEELTALEIWSFAARARARLLGTGAAGRRAYLEAASSLAERLGMRELRRPTRQLSHGNYRKLQLATWLGTGPPVVLLDEPHNGLDQHGTEVLTALLHEWTSSGAAVLMTSHAPEAHQLAHRVVEVADGQLTRPRP